MARHAKLLQQLLDGRADRSFRFDDLCLLLLRLGFAERRKGSHRIFSKNGVTEIINLQPRESLAKPYQVRQVRRLVLKYKLHLSLVVDDGGTNGE